MWWDFSTVQLCFWKHDLCDGSACLNLVYILFISVSHCPYSFIHTQMFQYSRRHSRSFPRTCTRMPPPRLTWRHCTTRCEGKEKGLSTSQTFSRKLFLLIFPPVVLNWYNTTIFSKRNWVVSVCTNSIWHKNQHLTFSRSFLLHHRKDIRDVSIARTGLQEGTTCTF